MKFDAFLLWGCLLGTSSSFQAPRVILPATRGLSKPLHAYVNIDESEGRDIATFQEWAQTYGVQQVDGFQLGSEDGLDIQAFTTEPIAGGNAIVSVPAGLIFSTSGTREEYGSYAEEAALQLNRLGAGADAAKFYLFLKVLVEYEKGDESPWFPWLNAMPRLFYNAVSMTSFCYECLPPLVFSLSRTERVRFDNYRAALQKFDMVSEKTKNDEALAKWAYNVVATRAFGSDDDKQIVPMADMFNHATYPNTALSFDEEGNCIAYTLNDVEANSPLCMSYGDPTNPSFLFARYGFLDETSPATFCKIMTIAPTPELKDLGLDFSRMLFYHDSGEISEEVWDVMLYSQVLGKERDVQQAFYTAHMNGDAETKSAIHSQYFLQTATALKSHVDSFLQQLDFLSAKGEGKSEAEHPRLPLILRHNEFVRTTFETVKSRLDPMVAEAAGQAEPVYS